MNADISGGRTAESPGPFNLAGHTLGKYRLIEKVGQGGMAQVYKAYQIWIGTSPSKSCTRT
jgi:serine/threonine protein kinase